jgi:biopolymer transport protein TolR
MAVTLDTPAGSSRRRGPRFRPRAEINVTPFVDVMLVLLIVFMVSAPLLTVGVPVNLPQTNARSLPSTPQEPLTITVTADGIIYVQETEYTIGELTPKLTAIIDARGGGLDERIFLRADSEAAYGAVMRVMAEINSAGLRNIGLVTDPLNE